MANVRYNVDGGLDAQVFFLNPMRFFGEASRTLTQHANALLQSFPNERGCRESAGTISRAAETLMHISKLLPARLVAYVYIASAFAARDHDSWIALVVLDNARRRIGNYPPTVRYWQQFPSALECNATILTGCGPHLAGDKGPAENIRMYVDFVLRAVNELEQEPHKLLFNAPGQAIFSIQEFLSRSGVSQTDRDRLTDIKVEICELHRKWDSRKDIVDIWFKSYFGTNDFRYWVLLCHCLSPLYWTKDPNDIVPLHRALGQYRHYIDRLNFQLLQLRVMVDVGATPARDA